MQNESHPQQKSTRAYGANGAMRASNAYKVGTFEGLNQRELMVESVRVMLQKLHLGRDCYRARKYDEMTQHHTKIFSILALLMKTLDDVAVDVDPPTRKLFAQFKHFYRGINQRLVFILNKPSVEDEFAKLIDELTIFYRLWQSAPTDSAPVAEENASPLSGGAIGRMA